MNRFIMLMLLVSSTAAAETIEPLVKPEAGFGIAVNNPMMWHDQESIGVSLYYRFMKQVVVRLNFANYKLAGSPVEHAVGFVREGYLDPPDDRWRGRAMDIGVGGMYFPRRAFDGPSVELGVVWREADEYSYNLHITREENARALVGWSWLMNEHLFAAVAAGGSVGAAHRTDSSAVMEERASMFTASFEGYVRLGLVFGN